MTVVLTDITGWSTLALAIFAGGLTAVSARMAKRARQDAEGQASTVEEQATAATLSAQAAARHAQSAKEQVGLVEAALDVDYSAEALEESTLRVIACDSQGRFAPKEGPLLRLEWRGLAVELESVELLNWRRVDSPVRGLLRC